MNYRRILYIAFIMFIVIWLWQNLMQDSLVEQKVVSSHRVLEVILAESDPEDVKTIYFPPDYQGLPGEVFYLTTLKDNEYITDKYRIVTAESGSDDEREWKIEQSWRNTHLPADRFEVYHLQEGRWQQ